MKFSIVFNNSGDTLPFSAINPDLVCYVLDQIALMEQGVFYPENQQHGEQIFTKILSLQQNVQNINSWFVNLTGTKYPEPENLFDYLDQDFLNYLHAFWVNSQSQRYDMNQWKQFPTPFSKKIQDIFPDDIVFPKLSTVMSRLGLLQDYEKININIHAIERLFFCMRFIIQSVDWVEWENPFPELANNDVCNLFLDFNHLGRTLAQKYDSFDFDLKYDDENSFFQIRPMISLCLKPPRKVPYSPEYIDWCKTKNREPVGNYMPLGNIPNLYEKLKEYRIIAVRNLIDNNGFTLQKDGN